MKKLLVAFYFCVCLGLAESALALPQITSSAQNATGNYFSKHLVVKPGLTEDEKVAALINYIRQLPNATFIRNGKDYPSQKAADHLQSKYKKHKKKVKTAQDFIDKLATHSSSKEPYQIRL